ncbi:MAG: hypothetical protein R3B70_43815, partial [Polyangiaceae bacterium]
DNRNSDGTYSRDVWARARWFAKNLKWDFAGAREGDKLVAHDKCAEQPAAKGSPDVTFNDKPALRRDDEFLPHSCDDHPAHKGKVKDGSLSVTINDGLPAARELDPVDCGGILTTVKEGSADIFLGD